MYQHIYLVWVWEQFYWSKEASFSEWNLFLHVWAACPTLLLSGFSSKSLCTVCTKKSHHKLRRRWNLCKVCIRHFSTQDAVWCGVCWLAQIKLNLETLRSSHKTNIYPKMASRPYKHEYYHISFVTPMCNVWSPFFLDPLSFIFSRITNENHFFYIFHQSELLNFEFLAINK